MSRSRKKFPGGWFLSHSKSMGKWKNQSNRAVRKKDEVASGSTYRRISDIWDSPSDGKLRWSDDQKSFRK